MPVHTSHYSRLEKPTIPIATQGRLPCSTGWYAPSFFVARINRSSFLFPSFSPCRLALNLRLKKNTKRCAWGFVLPNRLKSSSLDNKKSQDSTSRTMYSSSSAACYLQSSSSSIIIKNENTLLQLWDRRFRRNSSLQAVIILLYEWSFCVLTINSHYYYY